MVFACLGLSAIRRIVRVFGALSLWRDAGGVAFYDGVKETPGITEQRRWLDAIENDTDPVVLPEQACVVSEILEAIYTSARTGKPVYFD